MNRLLSNKFSKFLPKLINHAKQSTVNHQHAAVLIYNGDPVAWGVNNIKGNKTYHAEVEVIYRFLLNRGNDKRFLCKKQYFKQQQ